MAAVVGCTFVGVGWGDVDRGGVGTLETNRHGSSLGAIVRELVVTLEDGYCRGLSVAPRRTVLFGQRSLDVGCLGVAGAVSVLHGPTGSLTG